MAHVSHTHAEGIGGNRWFQNFVQKFQSVALRVQEARQREAMRIAAPYLRALHEQDLKDLNLGKMSRDCRL